MEFYIPSVFKNEINKDILFFHFFKENKPFLVHILRLIFMWVDSLPVLLQDWLRLASPRNRHWDKDLSESNWFGKWSKKIGRKVGKWVSEGKKVNKGALMRRLLLLASTVQFWRWPPRDCNSSLRVVLSEVVRSLGIYFSSLPPFVECCSWGD